MNGALARRLHTRTGLGTRHGLQSLRPGSGGPHGRNRGQATHSVTSQNRVARRKARVRPPQGPGPLKSENSPENYSAGTQMWCQRCGPLTAPTPRKGCTGGHGAVGARRPPTPNPKWPLPSGTCWPLHRCRLHLCAPKMGPARPQPPHNPPTPPGHWAGLPGGPIHISGFSEGKGGLATWFLEPSRAPAVGNSSPPTSGLPPGPRRERKRTRTRARDGKASGARTPQNCKANRGIILKSNISKMKVSVPKASAAAGIRWAGPWRLRLKPSTGESRLLQASLSRSPKRHKWLQPRPGK